MRKKYVIKKDASMTIQDIYKRQLYMKEIGLSKSYLSLVFAGKKQIAKVYAYAITKCTNINASVEDYFDEV